MKNIRFFQFVLKCFSSDSDAREKWSLTKDITWASCDSQRLSPLVR